VVVSLSMILLACTPFDQGHALIFHWGEDRRPRAGVGFLSRAVTLSLPTRGSGGTLCAPQRG